MVEKLRASSLDRLPRSYGVFKSHATGNRFRSRFVWMDREGGGEEEDFCAFQKIWIRKI